MFSGAARACTAGSWIVIALAGAATVGAQVPAELRGHVSDARSGRPVADARVEIVGQDSWTRTGPDGAFTIRGLEPRQYVVRVRAIGHAMRERSLDISNGRVTVLDLSLEPVAIALSRVVVNGDGVADGATAVFDRAAIERSGRRDVGELVAAAPGVVIIRAGGPGAASHASIRSSGANEVLVLVDGTPVNSELTGEADLSRISLETVDRVTVLTGAQSARYGGRALAGVIDIRTRRGARDLSVLGRTGSWGEREGAATVAGTAELKGRTLGGALTSDYRGVDGDFPYDVPAFRGGGTARRVNSSMRTRQLLGTTSLDGSGGSVAVRGFWEETERGIAGSVVQPSSTGHERVERRSASGDGAWTLGALSWTVAGDVTRANTQAADPAPPFGVAYDDSVQATSMRLSSTLAAGGPVLAALLGTEARSLDVRATALDSAAPRWQRVLGAWGQLRATHQVGAGGTLAAEAGVRVDQTSLIGATVASPRLLVSAANGGVTASASVSSGYAPPTLADQFFHEGVLVRANAALKPERTRRELEGRLAIRPLAAGPLLLSGEATAFRADIDGMILWLPDFRFIWSPSNYRVRRSGWELSGRASSSDGRVDVTGTLNDAAVTYAGGVLTGQVAYRPRRTAHLGSALTALHARFEITNEYVGARRTVPGSALNVLAPYWLTGARITSAIERSAWAADVALGVENLFDRPAAMLVDYPFPSRGWTLSVRVRRPDGRSAP